MEPVTEMEMELVTEMETELVTEMEMEMELVTEMERRRSGRQRQCRRRRRAIRQLEAGEEEVGVQRPPIWDRHMGVADMCQRRGLFRTLGEAEAAGALAF